MCEYYIVEKDWGPLKTIVYIVYCKLLGQTQGSQDPRADE